MPWWLLSVAWAGRPSFAPALEDYSVPASRLCFPSGLRVVVASDRSFPVASVTVVVDGGQAAGRIAHLEEHLWFRSRPGGGPEVQARLDALGAAHNAHTAVDHRAYAMIAPPGALADLGRLAAALLLEPLAGVDASVVEIERNLLRRESERGSAPVWELASAEAARQLFPAPHPYAAMAEGPVPTADLAALRAWSTAHDGPAHATIYVVGDFDLPAGTQAFLDALPDAALVDPRRPDAPLVAGTCSDRTPGPSAPPARAASEDRLPRVLAPVDAGTMVVGWSLPGAWRGSDVLEALAVRLFEGVLSYYVLQHTGAVREMQDGALDHALDCWLEPGSVASVATCAMPIGRRGSPEELLRLVHAAVDDVTAPSLVANDAVGEWLTESFTDQQIAVYSQLEDLGDAAGGRALAAAVHLHHTSSPTWLRDQLAEMDGVSEEALSELYRKWFRRDRMAAFVLEPHAVETAAATTVAALAPEVPAAPLPADAAALAAIAAAPSLTAPTRLPNGLEVLTLPLGTAPRAHVALFLPGGRWRARPGLDELHDWTARWWYALPDGTSWDCPREFLGDWSVRSEPGGLVVELSGLPGNVEAALWSVRDLLDHATVERTALDDGVRAYQGWLGNRPGDRVADAHAWRGLWPEVAPLVAEDSPALATVDGAAIADWQARTLSPDGALLVIAGRVDPSAAQTAARKWFGSWEAGPSRAPAPNVQAAPPRSVSRVDVPGAVSATVHVRCVAPGASPAATQVVAEALRERLWQAARAGTALTYDPDVRAWTGPARHGGLAFDATVAPADVDRLVATWDGALAGVAAGVGPAEVSGAGRAAASALRRRWTSVEASVEMIGLAWFAGQPLDALGRPAEALAAVEAAAMASVASACAQSEQIVVSVPSD